MASYWDNISEIRADQCSGLIIHTSDSSEKFLIRPATHIRNKWRNGWEYSDIYLPIGSITGYGRSLIIPVYLLYDDIVTDELGLVGNSSSERRSHSCCRSKVIINSIEYDRTSRVGILKEFLLDTILEFSFEFWNNECSRIERTRIVLGTDGGFGKPIRIRDTRTKNKSKNEYKYSFFHKKNGKVLFLNSWVLVPSESDNHQSKEK